MRCSELERNRPQIKLLVYPFNTDPDCLQFPLVTDAAASQQEMIELAEDDALKAMNTSEVVEFWKVVPSEKYPNIKTAALKLISMFGSTYRCESVFSDLSYRKSKHRASLSNERVSELLRLSRTSDTPDFHIIVKNKNCPKSR